MIRLLVVVFAVIGVLLVLIGVTSKLYRIPTASMEPTMHCARGSFPGCRGTTHDRILVSRVLYKFRDPKRGDVVAYKVPDRGADRCGAPGATFVHRIVVLPGESFRISNGVVYVDGRPLREPYVRRGSDEALRTRRTPKDKYVVMGDNRAMSCDSRAWGFLDRDRIIGPVIATYWPEDRISIR